MIDNIQLTKWSDNNSHNIEECDLLSHYLPLRLTGFLLGLLFYLEDGSNALLLIVGNLYQTTQC
jgi:hypothetical protein